MRFRVAFAIFTSALALLARPARATAQSWEALEAGHATIAGIEIVVTDVFDVAQAPDNTWLGHSANAVHIQTRRNVIARELLFAEGDTVNAQRIHETERNLRRYSFIREARIVPVRAPDGSVRARVEVFDAWSLDAGANFNRTGGSTTWSVNVDEANFLGAGKSVSFVHERNRERSANEIAYVDPQFLDSRWKVSLKYADLSDGRTRLAVVERPYYSVETRYGLGGFVSTSEFSLTEYHLGKPAYRIPSRHSTSALFGSRAYLVRDRTAFRIGATYRSRQSDYNSSVALTANPLPFPDTSSRRLRGPSVTWSMVQDRSATFENLASIGHIEDYNLGWIVSSDIGYFAKRFGSHTSASFGEFAARKGWRTGARGLLLMEAGLRGRHEATGWRDSVARAQLTAYNRGLKWHTLAANVDVVSVTRPDLGSWLYLDSTAGMRGLTDHFLAGDRRVVLSLDDRIITDWRILGLVQAGFVAYADAGAIRRFDTGRWSRLYANVGGGLRFGSLKGARGNVIQASVALPLVRDAGMDRVLLLLGNTVRF